MGFGGERLSYGELEARANRLARHLRRLGVGPEVRVGLCVERSAEMVVALLGILKAGGAYVPLDPSHPAERLGLVLEDSAVPVLVSEEGLLDRLPAHAARVVCLDRDAGGDRAARAPGRWRGSRTPENLAYVLYTSGSTGRPKGVGLPHRAVVNFLRAMAGRPGLCENDVVPALTTLSFDIAGLEIYLPLAVGGRVEVLGREEAADGARLAGRLAEIGGHGGAGDAGDLATADRCGLAGHPRAEGAVRRRGAAAGSGGGAAGARSRAVERLRTDRDRGLVGGRRGLCGRGSGAAGTADRQHRFPRRGPRASGWCRWAWPASC